LRSDLAPSGRRHVLGVLLEATKARLALVAAVAGLSDVLGDIWIFVFVGAPLAALPEIEPPKDKCPEED